MIARPDRTQSDLPFGIPPFEATSYSRESLVAALSDRIGLPSREVAVATLYAEQIVPDILAVIERARIQELESSQAQLPFLGLHISGGRRRIGRTIKSSSAR